MKFLDFQKYFTIISLSMVYFGEIMIMATDESSNFNDRNQQFHTVPGLVLISDESLVLESSSIIYCSLACFRENDCRAYSFSAKHKNCLLHKTSGRTEQNLQWKTGFKKKKFLKGKLFLMKSTVACTHSV